MGPSLVLNRIRLFTMSTSLKLLDRSMIVSSEFTGTWTSAIGLVTVGALLSVTVIMLSRELPRLSVARNVNVFAPGTRLIPSNRNLPEVSAFVVMLGATSTTSTLGSVVPTKFTVAVAVMRSPMAPVSDSGARFTEGGVTKVSKVKDTGAIFD